MHGQTLLIQSYGHALGVAASSIINQCLQLHQQRACALPSYRGYTARRIYVASLQENGRRIRHLFHTQVSHGKDAQFIHRAKTIFVTAKGAIAAACWAIQHHEAVDHMLQHLGPSDATFLGDMPHKNDDDVLLLGEPGKKRGGLADLGNGTRGRIHGLHLHDLYGVQYYDFRTLGFNELGDDLSTGLRGDAEPVHGQLQALGAQGQLLQGFLTGDIEHTLICSQRRGGLQ